MEVGFCLGLKSVYLNGNQRCVTPRFFRDMLIVPCFQPLTEVFHKSASRRSQFCSHINTEKELGRLFVIQLGHFSLVLLSDALIDSDCVPTTFCESRKQYFKIGHSSTK